MGWSPYRLCSLLGNLDARTDADLLGRFVAVRDGDAFAALVRRHGSMVMGVCRRVLRDAHAAEDAFQATFLVFARRAGAVRRRHLVANWLYGVAFRTASEARRAAVVRRAKEAKAAELRDQYVPASDGQPDLRDLLDRELALLPDVYRAAVVLCDLEGLPRKEAASRLGWAEGTLSGRLFRARALLAGRLSRYGLAVTGAAIVTTSQNASAAVPAGLMAAATRVGVLVAAGEAAAIVASAPVASLTEGVMKAMLLTKLKGMTAGLMVACAVTATGLSGWTMTSAEAQDQPTAGGRSAPRDPDKDRIARLEQERQELLRLVADLRARVADLEAAQKQRNLTAFDSDTGRQVVPDVTATPGGVTRVTRNPANTPGVPSVTAAPGVGVTGVALNPSNTPSLTAEAAPVQSVPPVAESAPGKPGAAAGRMAFKVYPAEDLAGDGTQAEAVVRILKAAVDPASWQAGAVAEHFPQGRALFVRQTADGHKQVAEVLELLRTAVTSDYRPDANRWPAPKK